MRPLLAICNVALLLVSLPAQGAELFYMDHDPITDQYVGPIGPLVMSGEITPGDYGRLLSKIIDDEDRFLAQNKILLASDGGDVAEALRIAALVKSLFTAVIVGAADGSLRQRMLLYLCRCRPTRSRRRTAHSEMRMERFPGTGGFCAQEAA